MYACVAILLVLSFTGFATLGQLMDSSDDLCTVHTVASTVLILPTNLTKLRLLLRRTFRGLSGELQSPVHTRSHEYSSLNTCYHTEDEGGLRLIQLAHQLAWSLP